jgi:hypothetical protein
MQYQTLAVENFLSQKNCLPTQNYISYIIIYLCTDFKIQILVFVKPEYNMWNYSEIHGIFVSLRKLWL